MRARFLESAGFLWGWSRNFDRSFSESILIWEDENPSEDFEDDSSFFLEGSAFAPCRRVAVWVVVAGLSTPVAADLDDASEGRGPFWSFISWDDRLLRYSSFALSLRRCIINRRFMVTVVSNNKNNFNWKPTRRTEGEEPRVRKPRYRLQKIFQPHRVVLQNFKDSRQERVWFLTGLKTSMLARENSFMTSSKIRIISFSAFGKRFVHGSRMSPQKVHVALKKVMPPEATCQHQDEEKNSWFSLYLVEC